MRHILELSQLEKRDFLNSFEFVLSDCDGVIWQIIEPIPKSGIAINLLKGAGKKYKFISNNSMRSNEDYLQKLTEIGVLNVNSKDLVHPVKTIIRHFQKNNMKEPVYTMACDTFNSALTLAGFNVIQTGNDIFNNINEFAEFLPVNDKCGAVIFDVDCNLTLAKLIKAQLYLKKPNCEFIVGASDMLMPLKDKLNILGPGGFIRMLSEVTGKKPIILGKPGEILGDYLIDIFKINEPKRVLFIGDALKQDISFGKKCGFQTLLMLSGATTKETLDLIKDDKKPMFYADSMADFIPFFNDLL